MKPKEIKLTREEIDELFRKEIKCLDPVIKYCQECPYGIVEYGSDVETYADTIGACFETSCMYGLEDTEPTKKELEEFEKRYRKQHKGKAR